MFEGHVIAQICCVTVIVKLQVPVFCEASVAVQVTVVVPNAKHVPEAGKQFTVALQLSSAVGVVYSTTAQVCCGGAVASIFPGQVTAGG